MPNNAGIGDMVFYNGYCDVSVESQSSFLSSFNQVFFPASTPTRLPRQPGYHATCVFCLSRLSRHYPASTPTRLSRHLCILSFPAFTPLPGFHATTRLSRHHQAFTPPPQSRRQPSTAAISFSVSFHRRSFSAAPTTTHQRDPRRGTQLHSHSTR